MRRFWLSTLMILIGLPLIFASSGNDYVTWQALAKLFAVLTFIPSALTSLASLLTGNLTLFVLILIGGIVNAAITYFLVLFLKSYLS